MRTKTNMTLKQALAKGYTYADQSWRRGYVSRKMDVMEQEVWEAGGWRKGQLYVVVPSWKSCTYSVRQYLKSPQA
jgi:hypothetical protein